MPAWLGGDAHPYNFFLYCPVKSQLRSLHITVYELRSVQ